MDVRPRQYSGRSVSSSITFASPPHRFSHAGRPRRTSFARSANEEMVMVSGGGGSDAGAGVKRGVDTIVEVRELGKVSRREG